MKSKIFCIEIWALYDDGKQAILGQYVLDEKTDHLILKAGFLKRESDRMAQEEAMEESNDSLDE